VKIDANDRKFVIYLHMCIFCCKFATKFDLKYKYET
jgi:hypothetical protein